MCWQCSKCASWKPIEDYYLSKGKPSSHCKLCHNAKHVTPIKKTDKTRGKGFQGLPLATKKRIIKAFKDGVKMTVIAERNNIKYGTLGTWKFNNKIHL